MKTQHSFSHLTLDERRIILTGISHGSTKAAIAKILGKDKSTIGKEIKLHRTLTHKCNLPLECNNYRKCVYDRQCTPDCPEYIPFVFCQVLFPEKSVGIPFFQQGIFPAFSGHYASLRMRACSIR